MTTWLPVTASALALTGLASFFATGGGDCTACTAPSSSTTTTVAAVEAFDAADDAAMDKMAKQDVYVLKFHADWCPKCKSLNPVYEAMVKEFDEKPVGFVILDVTNKETQKQTKEKIKELGLEDIWSKNEGRNGFMMIVDAQSKSSVKVLKAGTTNKQASEAITAALTS
eukprot:g14288.t1